tara:strand:- start:1465 stop:1710 length:246 start_codon:yes stop_codon:yes gene_type:complete
MDTGWEDTPQRRVSIMETLKLHTEPSFESVQVPTISRRESGMLNWSLSGKRYVLFKGGDCEHPSSVADEENPACESVETLH